ESRLEISGAGACLADLSKDARFVGARASGVYYGPVYFRKETEPYMAIALRAAGGGVSAVEVNLKFIWEVIQRIKIGEAGRAAGETGCAGRAAAGAHARRSAGSQRPQRDHRLRTHRAARLVRLRRAA